MSFHLRSLTARRYRVEGDLPSVHDAAFAKRLADRAFRPPSETEERAHGWVTADNCLDARFDAASVSRGPCAAFALRIDRRRVNGRILKAMLDLEMRGRRKDADALREGAGGSGGVPKRMKREERQELRRALSEELMRKTPPSVEVHTVLLFPKKRLVLFLSLSRAANETFRALFSETFDATLSTLTPFHRAVELLADRGAAEALAPLRRTEFGYAGATGLVADRLRPGLRPPAPAAAPDVGSEIDSEIEEDFA